MDLLSGKSSQDLTALNREAWDVRTEQHVESKFYDVEAWLQGATSLKQIELDLLRDISGHRLLHLQCHFGQDTLSLARLGAEVTGVDLSPKAIAYARQLAQRADLAAQFVESDVLQLQSNEALRPDAQSFDIVFSSYGTIGWLHDLDRWAETIKYFLRPGARLVFVEFHPFYELTDGQSLAAQYSYFAGSPTVETEGTYTDVEVERQMPTAYWSHPLSETIGALVRAGLQLQDFQEYDYAPYQILGELGIETAPGRWMIKGKEGRLPLCYSLVMTAPQK